VKLTPWFPAHIKPVRPGVYDTRFRDGPKLVCGYSFWTGTQWSVQWWRVETATARRSTDGAIQDKEWRGLTSPDSE